MCDTLLRLFLFKAWANDELLTALAKLGEEAPMTQLAIKALSHSHVVDEIFAAHLKRERHTHASTNLSEMSTLGACPRPSEQPIASMSITYRRSTVSNWRNESTSHFTDGATGRMSREEMLIHVITHGVGHRGQVSAVLLLNSVTSAIDGFATYLHRAEAAARSRTGF